MPRKSLSEFERAFAAARKKAGGSKGVFTYKGLEYSTAYKGERQKKPLSEFERRFAIARKLAGGAGGVFTYKGKKYNTRLKGEKPATSLKFIDVDSYLKSQETGRGTSTSKAAPKASTPGSRESSAKTSSVNSEVKALAKGMVSGDKFNLSAATPSERRQSVVGSVFNVRLGSGDSSRYSSSNVSTDVRSSADMHTGVALGASEKSGGGSRTVDPTIASLRNRSRYLEGILTGAAAASLLFAGSRTRAARRLAGKIGSAVRRGRSAGRSVMRSLKSMVRSETLPRGQLSFGEDFMRKSEPPEYIKLRGPVSPETPATTMTSEEAAKQITIEDILNKPLRRRSSTSAATKARTKKGTATRRSKTSTKGRKRTIAAPVKGVTEAPAPGATPGAADAVAEVTASQGAAKVVAKGTAKASTKGATKAVTKGTTKVEATKVEATKGTSKAVTKGATKVEATKVEATKVEATKVEAPKGVTKVTAKGTTKGAAKAKTQSAAVSKKSVKGKGTSRKKELRGASEVKAADAPPAPTGGVSVQSISSNEAARQSTSSQPKVRVTIRRIEQPKVAQPEIPKLARQRRRLSEPVQFKQDEVSRKLVASTEKRKLIRTADIDKLPEISEKNVVAYGNTTRIPLIQSVYGGSEREMRHAVPHLFATEGTRKKLEVGLSRLIDEYNTVSTRQRRNELLKRLKSSDNLDDIDFDEYIPKRDIVLPPISSKESLKKLASEASAQAIERPFTNFYRYKPEYKLSTPIEEVEGPVKDYAAYFKNKPIQQAVDELEVTLRPFNELRTRAFYTALHKAQTEKALQQGVDDLSQVKLDRDDIQNAFRVATSAARETLNAHPVYRTQKALISRIVRNAVREGSDVVREHHITDALKDLVHRANTPEVQSVFRQRRAVDPVTKRYTLPEVIREGKPKKAKSEIEKILAKFANKEVPHQTSEIMYAGVRGPYSVSIDKANAPTFDELLEQVTEFVSPRMMAEHQPVKKLSGKLYTELFTKGLEEGKTRDQIIEELSSVYGQKEVQKAHKAYVAFTKANRAKPASEVKVLKPEKPKRGRRSRKSKGES